MGDSESERYKKAFDKAYQIFGNENDAHAWLNEPSIPLGKVTPKSLLGTQQGLELVLYELVAMEYGLPV